MPLVELVPATGRGHHRRLLKLLPTILVLRLVHAALIELVPTAAGRAHRRRLIELLPTILVLSVVVLSPELLHTTLVELIPPAG
jgi:hypothetical protein